MQLRPLLEKQFASWFYQGDGMMGAGVGFSELEAEGSGHVA